MNSIVALVLTLVVCAIESFTVKAMLPYGNVWLQGYIAMIQLNIIVALTRDGSKSWCSHALRTPFAQWLGDISMTVYLFHSVIIYNLRWGLSGKALLRVPGGVFCKPGMEVCADYYRARTMPLWGIPFVLVVTCMCGTFITKYFEAPVRKALRAK